MNALTDAQRRAVRYYIGDVEGDAPFWSNGKAYVVLNSLFFPGIETERARAAEGKRLDPEILADEARLIGLLRDLMSAFRPSGIAREVCRVERHRDFLQMETAGRTVSFTSTCQSGFLPQYGDRVGVVLMRFMLTAETPCIPMADVLPHYAKADEDEILLPPFLPLTFRDDPPSPAELAITDANGDPPVRCVIAEPGTMPRLQSDPLPLPKDGAAAGRRVFAALTAGETPDDADVLAYTSWKTALLTHIL